MTLEAAMLVLLASVVLITALPTSHEEIIEFELPSVTFGSPCQPQQVYRPMPGKTDTFFECIANSTFQIGLWQEKRCPDGLAFNMVGQNCTEPKTIRRQQAIFAQQPQLCNAAPMAQPAVGQSCQWMSAQLSPCQQPQMFYQCAPTVVGNPCGQWIQQPCGGGQVFNAQTQCCTPVAVQATCPVATQTAVCPCGPQAACPSLSVCIQSTCCCDQPTPAPAPARCPLDGSVALGACSGTGQGSCQTGQYCINNVCCPLPRCSSGQPASAVCSAGGACPAGTVCVNNGCCPLPPCPSGQTAVASCSGTGTCPQADQYCYRGPTGSGCCPVPRCADGSLSQSPCTNGQCPPNFTCFNGGCCPQPLPTCPTNGQLATQRCTGPGTCGGNMYCYLDPATRQGGCCPLPNCPNNQPAMGMCTNGQCAPGATCFQNLACCPLAPCPGGDVPVQACGVGNSCPSGYVCNGGSCCAPPLPSCSDGSTAISRCTTTGASTCPSGYSCVNGGCCPVQQQTCQPVCQCAQITLACPMMSTCNQGACCAPTPVAAPAPYPMPYAVAPMPAMQVPVMPPGGTCGAASQCSGFPAFSSCVNSFCSCVGGARSNGFSCTNRVIRYRPRRITRRHPASQQESEQTETDAEGPEWWESLPENNKCISSNDCTPNKVCIEDKCTPIKQPGETGCVSNEQCINFCDEDLCPDTVCVEGRCGCLPGNVIIDGECVNLPTCPEGMILKGDECVEA